MDLENELGNVENIVLKSILKQLIPFITNSV